MYALPSVASVMKQIVLLILISLASLSLVAQIDTNVVIDDVIIYGQVSPRSSVQRLRSEQGQKVDRTLGQNALLFVKDHGPSQISTLSYRGGNASQTSVMWNGIPIGNPILGLTDLSLVDGFMIDQAQLSDHEHAISSVAGELNLETDLPDDHAVQLLVAKGSFGRVHSGLQGNVKLGRWRSNVRLLRIDAQNDFEYETTSGSSQLPHAEESRNSFQYNGQLDIDSLWTCSYNYWWSDTKRQIPPLTTQTRSESTQDDKSHRHVLSLLGDTRHGLWKATVGYSKESILYKDPSIALSSFAEFDQYYTDIEGRYKWADWSFGISNRLSHTNVINDGYTETHQLTLWRSAAKVYRYIGDVQLLAEGGFVSNVSTYRGIYKYGLRWMPSAPISIHYSGSNAYRFPTTNDLFWSQGGDPDLLPESATKQEVGLRLEAGRSTSVNATYFYRDVRDWILWSRPDGATAWQVYNVSHVKSYGALLDVTGTVFDHNEVTIGYQGQLSYTRSSNQKALPLPKIDEGDQLFYTPLWSSGVGAKVAYKTWNAFMHHRYTGKTVGVIEELDSYQLVDVSISKQLRFTQLTADIKFQINNITNQQYRVVERRPMPGRNYLLTFITKIK